MDKKFYEMPEVEVINLDLEGAILGPSDPNIDDDGKVTPDPTPGGDDDFD